MRCDTALALADGRSNIVNSSKCLRLSKGQKSKTNILYLNETSNTNTNTVFSNSKNKSITLSLDCTKIAEATAAATTRAFLIVLHLKEQFLRSDAEGTGAAEGNFRFCLLCCDVFYRDFSVFRSPDEALTRGAQINNGENVGARHVRCLRKRNDAIIKRNLDFTFMMKIRKIRPQLDLSGETRIQIFAAHKQRRRTQQSSHCTD